MGPRWLCWASLSLALFACGGESQPPCAPADAVAKRCQEPPAPPFPLAPGQSPPAWAENLCAEWRRVDGSCDLPQLIGDYQECRDRHGVPERDRLAAQGLGSFVVQRGFERATFLCLELRRWFRAEPAGAPAPPAPPS